MNVDVIMMTAISSARRFTFAFGFLATCIISTEWWFLHSAQFLHHPEISSIGVTFDIVAVIPALFYFLVLRPRKASPLLVVPFFVLCMIMAGFLVPSDYHGYLVSLYKIIPVFELALIGFVITRIPAFLRVHRESRASSVYQTDSIFAGLQNIISSRVIVAILSVEFFLIWFAFTGWFLRWKDSPGRRSFTYHRKSGYSSILLILMFVLVAETFAVHLIVAHWSLVWAWSLTILSLYSLLWLAGDYHAIRLHPIVLSDDTLHLRTGLRFRADIPIEMIEDIHIGTPGPKAAGFIKASILWPRAEIRLKQPYPIDGLFGIRKNAMRVGISADNPEELREAVIQLNKR